MENQKDQIVIVGAGIAGLSLAILLAQKNIPCVVLEARSSFGSATSGVRISAKGVKVLESMGIRNIGEATEKLLMYFGSKQIAFDVKNTTGASPAIIVTRLAVFEELRKRIAELKIPVLYNYKLDYITENADGVEATSTDGQVVKGRYLVGADGVGSKVRKVLNPNSDADKRYAGYLGLGFIYPSNQKIGMSLHNNTNGNIGLASIGKIKPGDDYTNNFIWTHIHMPEQEAKSITDKEVWEQIELRSKNWSPELQRVFQQCKVNPNTILYHQPVYNGSVPKNWFSEKMFLIGDAAHPYGPGGQGISMALMDAESLCELFSTGLTEEKKINFVNTRASMAKSKGESSEERNKPENQIKSAFGLWWNGLLMSAFHIFKNGKMEL